MSFKKKVMLTLFFVGNFENFEKLVKNTKFYKTHTPFTMFKPLFPCYFLSEYVFFISATVQHTFQQQPKKINKKSFYLWSCYGVLLFVYEIKLPVCNGLHHKQNNINVLIQKRENMQHIHIYTN